MGEALQTADYVIVGAGSAGCVIASRLSETGASVVLLEAGPPDRSPWIHIPAGVIKLPNHPVLSWNYVGEPDPGIGGRQMAYPRGRTLGGSSSINGMHWVRGNRADYDRWAQMGATGWSYEDVLPYLRSIESYSGGESAVRGGSGPIPVRPFDFTLPITDRFAEAAQQRGYPLNDDLNGDEAAEGICHAQVSHTGRRRASTAQTFLKAARGRKNLTVETGALATRLLFEGRRCAGVTIRQKGRDRTVLARREVILSGGAINSPQLLQISGVGPADHLRSIGVEVVHDLPGVGRNLNDHYGCRVTMRVKNILTVNQLANGWRLAREVVKYGLFGTGALTLGVTAAQLFARTRPELAAPDLQFLFIPASHDIHRLYKLERAAGMTLMASIANPESRGEVMAKSADPFEYPAVRPNYLSAPNDLRTLVAGMRIAREIFAAPAFAPYVVEELGPGPQAQTDAELEDFARRTGGTLHHLSGTCRIGIDPLAVVDPSLKVHGIEGLRVADVSVMPTVTTGNTNASVVMIGEKAAAMISGRA